MSDGVVVPRSVYSDEAMRLRREAGHTQEIEELIGSIPEGLADRGRVIEAVREATRTTSTTVQKFFAIPLSTKDWIGEWPSSFVTNITERGFFNDPKTVEKYGQEVVNAARQLIIGFSGRKAGIETKQGG